MAILSCSSRHKKVRLRMFSLWSSVADCLRSPQCAVAQKLALIFVGQRIRAMELNTTCLLIGLELPEQPSAAGTPVWVRE